MKAIGCGMTPAKRACWPRSPSQQEAAGIVHLIRLGHDKTLTILEQARFVVDLLTIHNMALVEVAQTLRRSKAWVSMRRGLWEEMSPAIQEFLFAGAFPVYSYMYTLRPFRRMNAMTAEQIERFVQSLAGGLLSLLPSFQERIQEFHDRSGHA